MDEYRHFFYILVMALLLALWSYSAHSTQVLTRAPSVSAHPPPIVQVVGGCDNSCNSI